MLSFIEIDGKKYHGVSQVATEVGYSRDYISKLARDKKIIASQVGRQWYVDLESLKAYIDQITLESKNRQQQLSEERRLERLAAARRRREAARRKVVKNFSRAALHGMVVSALVFGVGFGYVLSGAIDTHNKLAAGESVSPLLAQLATALQKFPIAIDTEVVPAPPQVAVQFAETGMSLATLDTASNGVLLLPHQNGATSTDPTELFSDKVEIVTDESGQTYVARVKEDGEVKGRIPYVVVPVNHTTP
jgi:excisionase family DNA binding protein